MPPLPRRKRQLPFVSQNRRFSEPGVGTFAAEIVGTTRYTTGVYIYSQAEGADEARSGAMAYQLVITEDFKIDWVFTGSAQAWPKQEPQPDAFSDAGLAFVRKLEATDENAWMFLVMGRIEMFLDAARSERDKLTRSVDHLSQITDGRPLKPGTRPVEELQASLQMNREKLTEFEERVGPREARLADTLVVIRKWCHGKHPKTSIAALIRESLEASNELTPAL